MPTGTVLEVPHQIALAISLASTATGADFDYLVKTAARESGFRPEARAASSSARGLFQFIESTWLKTLKEDGARLGLGHYAEHIKRARSGRYYVPNDKVRGKILGLRNDPHISSMMAGAFARRNSEFIRDGIGRRPTAGELYLAHFLGASDAIRLIRASARTPNRKAHRLFPPAARANRPVFFDGDRPRTVREVYRSLVAKYDVGGKARDSRNLAGWNTLVVHQNRVQRRRAAAQRRGKSRVRKPALKLVSLPRRALRQASRPEWRRSLAHPLLDEGAQHRDQASLPVDQTTHANLAELALRGSLSRD